MPNQGISEQAIHKAVISHLKVRALPGVFYFHCPNGGFRRPIEAAIFKSLGLQAGVPDILAVRDGMLFALELKSAGGKLSDAQIDCQCRLQAAGAYVWTAYSLDEALKSLEFWGLLRGKART